MAREIRGTARRGLARCVLERPPADGHDLDLAVGATVKVQGTKP